MNLIKKGILFIFSASICSSFGQLKLAGVWQGVLQIDGQPSEKSMLLYAEFKQIGSTIEGKMREELFSTDLFSVKRLKGTITATSFKFSQSVIEKKKQTSKTNWCLIEGVLNYSDSSGYLTGKFTSSDCKRYTGSIILYQSNAQFSATEASPLSHSWVILFFKDYIFY